MVIPGDVQRVPKQWCLPDERCVVYDGGEVTPASRETIQHIISSTLTLTPTLTPTSINLNPNPNPNSEPENPNSNPALEVVVMDGRMSSARVSEETDAYS